jgi:two-component system invasion response regulator UvrY
MRKILLVDDHAVVRDGIRRIFADQPDEFSFAEAGTRTEALEIVANQECDLVVLDITLGKRDGLELIKELKQLRPKLPVLILSMHSEEHFARRAFKAGAAGYISKETSRAELVTAMRKVLAGGRYVSPAFAEQLTVDLTWEADRPPHEGLSDREFEVLRLIASGHTVGSIAELLSLSDKTISTYRARILEKMGMKTNAELTHYALRNRLVE